jgi:hypothetical protein
VAAGRIIHRRGILDRTIMRTLTGAILLAAAEQSYAHSCLIGFPNQQAASQILVPASLVGLVLGMAFLVWGILTDGSRPRIGRLPPHAPVAAAGTTPHEQPTIAD